MDMSSPYLANGNRYSFRRNVESTTVRYAAKAAADTASEAAAGERAAAWDHATAWDAAAWDAMPWGRATT
jgi:hypothetical protein